MATAETETEPCVDTCDQGCKSRNLAEYVSSTDLQTVIDYIGTITGDIAIDERNDEGQTALMRACFDRKIQVVEFLLARGADPNLRCLKEGNTALHYVSKNDWSCNTDSKTELEDLEHYTDNVLDSRNTGKNSLADDEKRYCLDENANQCSVVKKYEKGARLIDMLVSEHGALMQTNKNGLTPADMAGLHRKLPIVMHYIDKQYIPTLEQIRALEILGTSMVMKNDYKNAYFAFTMAMEKRCEGPNDDSKSDITRSRLEVCLGRPECRTLNDLRKINGDKHGMKVQGFLVGNRVFPDSLKPEFIYESLADYGYRLLFLWNMLDTAFVVLTECLHLECNGLILVGRVLCSLMYSIGQATSSPSLHRVLPQYVTLLCQCLEAYVDVIKQVHIDNLRKGVQEILINLSKILYSFTNHLCKIQGVDRVLEPVAEMITIIWRRLPRNSVARDPYRHLTNSVCHKLLCDMIDYFRYYYEFDENRYTCLSFKKVLFRLVQVEGATDVDTKGDTLLHSLMGLVYFGEIQMIKDIAHLFLRCGCPTSTKNNLGKLPIDIAEDEASSLEDHYLPDLTELYSLLSPSLLTLQETCIRTILRCNIHYENKLPNKLSSLLHDVFLDDFGPEEPIV